jgi:hypothetical protein
MTICVADYTSAPAVILGPTMKVVVRGMLELAPSP